MSPDGSFIAVFIDEANERLDRFVERLLTVEAGTASADAVEQLLRDIHTIKGSAAMVGLSDISAIAHALEDVLMDARRTGTVDGAHVEPLLRAADALRREVAGAGSGAAAALLQLAGGLANAEVAATPQPAERAAAPSAPAARPIRVAADKIDALLGLVGETVLHRGRLEHLVRAETGKRHSVDDELDTGDRLLAALKTTATAMRTMPLATIAGPYARAVRDAAASEGKEVELVVTGGAMELDRTILEALAEPLAHLLRNAVAHGIELPEERVARGKPSRGRIELRAQQRGAFAQILVEDDGGGVAPELVARGEVEGSLVDVLAQSGLSTAESVNQLAGRGVGLSAVRVAVAAVGGTLEIETAPGAGTLFTLSLPLTLALLDVLLVERGGGVYGIPLAAVEEVVAGGTPLALAGKPQLDVRGAPVALVDLAALVGYPAPPARPGAPAVVVVHGARRVAAVADALLGESEVVVKPFGPLLGVLPGYLGAAILGDGRIAPLLDPEALVGRSGARAPELRREPPPDVPLTPKVLVAEDSPSVRELQRTILEVAGYRVVTAYDGRDALEQILRDDEIALLITDFDMPELSGIELTAAVRATPGRASLPIVIVTSRDDDADRERGAEAGADVYMLKRGFEQQKLLETVARLVDR
jgi:two-component system chemotaxis sensor kinase CheA